MKKHKKTQILGTVGIKGNVTLRTKDVRTDEITKEITVQNMILDTAFNRMTLNGNLRNSSTNHLFLGGANSTVRLQCNLSTAQDAISATQGTLPGVFATEIVTGSGSSNSNLPGENYRATRRFFFPNVENVTRNVRTVYLSDAINTSFNASRELIAAVLLPEEVELGSFDTLEVIWTINYNFSNGSGSITNGNHLGDTNISWNSYISEANALNMLTNIAIMSSQGIPVLGTDNTASDSNTSGIKGTEISGTSSTQSSPDNEFNVAASGQWISYQRRQWLEGESTGEIGEMATNSYRITFNPKLNKQETWRLWLTFGMVVARDPIT
jgi:hypothetical protein